MTTAACSKWRGLFSVEELDDEGVRFCLDRDVRVQVFIPNKWKLVAESTTKLINQVESDGSKMISRVLSSGEQSVIQAVIFPKEDDEKTLTRLTLADLFEGLDWTHASDSGASAVPAHTPLQESHAVCSHDAQSDAFSNRSTVQPNLSEFKPVKGLRSLANSNAASVCRSVPHTHAASSVSLQASTGRSNAIWSQRQSSNGPFGRSNPQSDICDVPKKMAISAPDDFDDWDVDLEELDKCVHQKASAPDTGSAPDSVSPAKRTRSSAVRDATPVASSLRGFCNSTRKCAPPQSCTRSTSSPEKLHQSLPPSCRFTRLVTPGAVSGASQWPGVAVTPRAEHRSLFQAVSPAISPLTPRTPRPLHMPVLTNHLVQLVSAASKTPQRPRSDTVRSKTRRFPGPAGALPQQISGRSLDDIVVAVPQTPAHGAVARLRTEVPSSQANDEEEFSVGPWAAMKAEMGLNERNTSCFLHSYSIVMVLRKAALRQLSKNKVPNMAVVLKSVLHTHADAKAVFRDPTGEMQGTVHRRLLEDRQGELKTGAVLLLKQVGVFSPSNRNHYLNVTPNNLLRIYPPDGAVQASSQHSESTLGPAELLRCESAKHGRGPVSRMDLHYEEEEEVVESKREQRSIRAQPTVAANGPRRSATCPNGSEDAHWDADDLDELLGELPVDSY